VGIGWAFLFLFTIPGWFGIRAWRRYRRGEQSSIKGYAWFGGIAMAVLVASMVGVAAVGGFSDSASSSTPSPITVTEPTTASVTTEPCVDLGDVATSQRLVVDAREMMLRSGSLVRQFRFGRAAGGGHKGRSELRAGRGDLGAD
jgi:hypothetical protein